MSAINNTVKIYRGSEVILETQINEGAKGVFSLKTSDYIILPFSLPQPIYFNLGDYVNLEGVFDNAVGALMSKRYEITEKQQPTYNEETGGYDYQLKLDAYYWKWKNKIFKYIPENAAGEASWSLTAPLDVHMGVFLRNLKALDYKYNDVDFEVSIDSTVENKAVAMTYDNISLLDALFAMSAKEAWNCDVWVTDNIIHFGRNEYGDAVKIERNVEAGNITRANSKGDYGTRFFAFGSTRNIPTNYRPTDEQPVVNGIVQKRLMLPAGTPYIDAIEGMTEDEAVEKVVVFDDVFPRRVGELSDVTSHTEEIENEDGIKETIIYYRYKDTGLLFKDEYYLEGEKLKVKFESGKMNGLEFEVTFDPDNKGEQLWEIVRNNNYGRFLPDDTIKPENGDYYVLSGFNIKLVSNKYISDAEQELKEKATEYAAKAVKDDSTFQVPLRSSWVYEDIDRHLFDFGQRINLIDTAFFENGRFSRVLGWEIKLDIPWDSPIYTIGESMPYSRIGEIEDKIDSLTYKGQSYTSIGGNSIYIISTNDSTSAKDSNVYSAKRSDKQFLHSDRADVAQKQIDFKEGLTVGNFTNMSGGAMIIDEDGHSYGEVDKLKVRMKAYFESLEVQEVNTTGGKVVISPAGAVTLAFVDEHRVETVENEDGESEEVDNGIPEGVYRCYFLGEQDGVTVENKWKEKDQAMSRTFNVTVGIHQGVSNHYYWRLVTAVSNESTMLEKNGLKYHWIDLLKAEADTDSGIPVAADVVAQVGNREDKTRQSALIFSAVDTYSPSITLYNGIDHYTFLNKEYVEYGVNKDKAFFRVFGDFYVGDRIDGNEKEFVKYENGKVDIAGTVHIGNGSTIGGTLIEEYIKDNGGLNKAQEALDEITNTRNSLDALETNVNQFKTDYDNFASDGVFTSAEVAALQEDARYIESVFQGAKGSYDKVITNSLLDEGQDSTAKTDLITAFDQLERAKYELVAVIDNAVDDYKDNKFESAEVNSKYNNFNNKYNAFYQALNIAERYITDKTVNNKVKGLDGLLANLALADSTDINGGLILTSMVALRNASDPSNPINAGINGVQNAATNIATWWGGGMQDKQQFDNTFTGDGATSLIRFDGSGYFANGAIWWNKTGQLHADPLSFFVGDNYVGLNLALFQFVPNNVTKIENVNYVIPQAPFEQLNVVDNIAIGKIKISWDAANNALKVESTENGKTANLYATGGVSALGMSSVSGGGTGGSGASALYELVDVLANSTNTGVSGASQGSLLGYNGSHWVAVSQSSIVPDLTGYVTVSVMNTALSSKVDKVSGKGLSTNDFTTALLNKLNGIEDGANKYVLPTAETNVLGGVKLGYTSSGKNYKLQADASGNAFVNVPWTDTVYTLTKAKVEAVLTGDITSHTHSQYLTAHQAIYALTLQRGSVNVGTYTPNSAAKTINIELPTFAEILSKPTTLAGYGITDGVNSVTVTGSGNAVTAASVSGHSLTLTKGATYLTKSTFDDMFEKVNVGTSSSPKYAIRAKYDFYSDGGISALGIGSASSSGGGGLIETVLEYSDLTSSVPTDNVTVFNADTVKKIYDRIVKVENGALDSRYYTESEINTKLADGSVTKVSTATVGGTAKPIYLNAGVPTAISATVGSTSRPVYLNAGTITACTASSLFSVLANSGNSISITIAGQNRTLTPAYATNCDTVDSWHGVGLSGNVLRKSGCLTSNVASLSSYWGKVASFTWEVANNDRDITLYMHSAYNEVRGIVHIRARWSSATSFIVSVIIVAGNLNKDNLRLYYDASKVTGTLELWYNVGGQYGGINTYVISETARMGVESEVVTLYNALFTAVQTPALTTYTSASYLSLDNNVASATRLQTARTINGTSFDGSANITTARWGTARNIYIADATAAHTGAAVSVNGSGNVTLKLPTTITAELGGNALTATTLKTARTIWGQSFNGSANVSGNMTGVGSISASGEITTTSPNAFRMINGDYGAFWRNDADSLYLLLTDSGNPTGSYNTLRPFAVKLSTGTVTFGTDIAIKKTIQFNNGQNIIEWDAANNAFKFNGNLYATGGISALGASYMSATSISVSSITSNTVNLGNGAGYKIRFGTTANDFYVQKNSNSLIIGNRNNSGFVNFITDIALGDGQDWVISTDGQAYLQSVEAIEINLNGATFTRSGNEIYVEIGSTKYKLSKTAV